MKRSISIKHNNDTPDIELNITKAALVNADAAEFIYLEKMKDGTFRLTATKNLIEDFSVVDCLKINREE
jgi:hypothetical protein